MNLKKIMFNSTLIITSTTVASLAIACKAPSENVPKPAVTNETELLKYINENLTQTILETAVNDKLNELKNGVKSWNSQNDKYKITIDKADVSNIKWNDNKVSYTITFNTKLQGISYTRVETVDNAELVVSDNVGGTKQVGFSQKLLQTNNRLIDVEKSSIEKTNIVSVHNFFKTWFNQISEDDFEKDFNTVKNITIYHTNDIHGRLDEDASPFNQYIGLANFAAYAKTYPADLLIDAGDLYQGTGESNLDKGLSASKMISAAGFQGIAIGNHEFDYGKANFLKLNEIAPYYSSNIYYKDTVGNETLGQLLSPSTRLYTIKGDLQVALVPFTTEDTAYKTNPANTENVGFADIIETAKQEIAKLKALGINFIIGYGHLGDDITSVQTSVQMLNQVKDFDLFIDGHSHRKYEVGRKIGDTYIVQTGSYTQHLGSIKFDFNKTTGKVENWSNKYINLEEFSKTKNDLVRNETVDKLRDEAISKFAALKTEVAFPFPYSLLESITIGSNRERTVRLIESSAGNFFADAMQWKTQTSLKGTDNSDLKVISIQNGGGVRASINVPESGRNLTQGDLLLMSPFNNTLISVKITGAQLKQILAFSAKNWGAGSFLQFGSNLEVSYNLNFVDSKASDKTALESNSVTSIKYQGVEIKDEDVFALATNDFIRAGGDGYSMIKDNAELVNGNNLNEVMVEYGQFLNDKKVVDKLGYSIEMYSNVYIKPSEAKRIKINPTNDAAKSIISKFEAAS
ncbi:UDP-sugar diphosphatase [Mycoplasma testudineum]|uniref:UDP-sugar diphosphatase n=1 Tax=Mycoplasma testudineum TaxID=244584 RepID=A0A4R6IFD6_9MOLU|nr:bifunctional UDP-sugar hydrolase/5'-nucleotidase [Mycoplasma testudineum]OYD26947.1 hypothetical protein CG473_01240 [Mycoplasma testudineum]TDO20496.1 UDP-sugar diphosphatase [Mycoplasma testudineum]